MTMDKENRFFELMYALRHQYPVTGVSTYNHCSTEGCTYSVRGAGKCASCVEKEFAGMVGKCSAETLHRLIRETAAETRRVLLELNK